MCQLLPNCFQAEIIGASEGMLPQILREESQHALLVFGWMSCQCARMAATWRDPLLLWLASSRIELPFAREWRSGVPVVR